MFHYNYAFVRPLPSSFVDSLKMEQPDVPIDLSIAKKQHETYTNLLKSLIPNVIEVPVDDSLPDCVFIEDTAVFLGKNNVIVTIPGAISRQPETKYVLESFSKTSLKVNQMVGDARVDGGDVLLWKDHVFVGLSKRTNAAGVDFFKSVCDPLGISVHAIPVPAGLHLKSAVSLFSEEILLAADDANGHEIASKIIEKAPSLKAIYVPDAVCCNVLRIGSHLVIQDGFPRSERILQDLAFDHKLTVHKLDMSETIKADGALTCCSILFSA